MRVTQAALLHMKLQILPGLDCFGGDQGSCFCVKAVDIVGYDGFNASNDLLGLRNGFLEVL